MFHLQMLIRCYRKIVKGPLLNNLPLFIIIYIFHCTVLHCNTLHCHAINITAGPIETWKDQKKKTGRRGKHREKSSIVILPLLSMSTIWYPHEMILHVMRIGRWRRWWRWRRSEFIKANLFAKSKCSDC